ncbi:general amidase [Roridomyces roridus]|uniref:General amidase n=1 Tax=Roridomyces roridus TaxID=1738132 RepID=A0AAD7BV92_9AGAR|nr:general amidase [Roridomyces roridus]
MSWQEIATEKKAHQLDSVPKEWISSNLPSTNELNVIEYPRTFLSPLDIEITESQVPALISQLAEGKWSAVQVTTSFYKRAIIAQQLTNCLTEIFVDRALSRAKELDEHLEKTGTVVGPLHGLPISLKDQISIKGIDSTMGYVSWIGKPAEKNSVLVDILESLGAVPFVKTNIPQTLMASGLISSIPYPTSNPYNRSLTSGGSSGGEGALASIRIPSAFCGVYGFRPSSHRVPYAGCVNSLEGEDAVVSVLGPLSNSLDGIKLFYKSVLSKQPWLKDPLVVRKRWSEDEYNLIDHGSGGQLCFAIMWHNGVIVPDPPIRRGLEMTKDALLAAGHKVIDWTPHKQAEITETWQAIWNSGSDEDFKRAAAPEPVIESMGLLPEDTPLQFRPDQPSTMTAFDLWQVHKQRRDLRQEYAQLWEDSVSKTGTGRPVDAIICPAAPYAAPPHGLNNANVAMISMAFNLLDYPALVIPVSHVDQQFYTQDDREGYERYDPKIHEHAPIVIQVVGRTMEEEAVIAMSEIVDKALKATK